MDASSGVYKMGFSRIYASQHRRWVALLPKADQVPIVPIDIPVLNKTNNKTECQRHSSLHDSDALHINDDFSGALEQF